MVCDSVVFENAKLAATKSQCELSLERKAPWSMDRQKYYLRNLDQGALVECRIPALRRFSN